MKHNSMKNQMLVLYYGVLQLDCISYFNAVRSLHKVAIVSIISIIHLYVGYTVQISRPYNFFPRQWLILLMNFDAFQAPFDYTDFNTNEVKKRGCDSVSRPIQSGFSVTNQSTTTPQPSMQNPTAPADDFNKLFVLCFQGCKYLKKSFCYSSVIVPNVIILPNLA